MASLSGKVVSQHRYITLSRLQAISLTVVFQIAITGASSGIGRATCQILASRGALLSLADLDSKGLQATVENLHSESSQPHVTTIVDVRNSEQVEGWIEDTVARLGGLDGAINLAGVVTDGVSITEETDAHWDILMGVNAKGVFNCMRAQLKHIRDGGAVVSQGS